MIIAIIVVFSLIALSSFPGLIKNRDWYELTVLSIFFIFAFVIALLPSLGIEIPSPLRGVKSVMKDVLHLSYQ